MNVISLILPYVRKVKLFLPALSVGILTYFICLRWKRSLSPWYLYVGLAVGITLLITLIVKFFKWRHQRKMNAGLEAGLSEGEEGKVDLGGEIKALRENWRTSLDQLKASRLGQNKAVLFQLPWYIIIGEPASGKSTLLRKSGLDFPVGDAAVAGLHGTRNCDWWFANEAVFLDTAGRYVMETQEAEWVAFLDLLKKYRTKKPINGVLVALPANSLLTKSHDELLLDGKRIRSRVDELIEHLGVNFPIYVLVTKVDLVSGFVEFFSSLDHRYGEQMVGWTVAPEGETTFDRESFSERFEETAGRLFRMRPWLESTAKKRDLLKAFLYPEEFLNLGEPVREVLDIVFRPNIYQETPVCRGVYFSSGTQVGSPLAKTLQEMAKDLNIPADFDLGLEMQEEKEVRTYFIKDLVSEQILKDKHMSWRTWQAEARTRKKRMGWGLIGLGVVALAALLAVTSFFRNQDRLTAFQVSIPERALPLEAGIGCLNTRDKAEHPDLFDVGLNFSDMLIPSMTESFFRVFGEGCVNPTLDEFWKIASKGPPMRKVGNRDVPDVWHYLESYRHFLYYRQALQGRLDPGKKDWDKDWEKEHLDYLFKVLLDKRAAVSSESTVADMRRSLCEYARPARIEFHAPRLGEIGEEFDRHLMDWLKGIEGWIARAEGSGQKVEQDFDRSFQALKEACLRNKVIPHDRPEKVTEVARILYNAAYPSREDSSGSEGPGLADLTYGAVTVGEVRKYMTSAKEIARDDGPVPPKVDDLLPRLGKERSSDQVEKLQQAQQSFLGYLDGIINERIPETSYDAFPTREGLGLHRDRISRDIQNSANLAWDRVKVPVLVVESRADTVMDPTTGMLKAGWWDTLIDLSRAKTADVLQAEYLSKGLTPFLKGPQWRTKALGEDPAEILTKNRLQELIQVEFMNQRGFFGKPELARSIAGNADGEMREAIDSFVGDMEKFWLARLKSAIPPSPGTLVDLYKHVDMWSNTRGDFLITCDDIEGAVYGIRKLSDDEDGIPFLRATQDERARLFDTFAVCFRNVDDRAVQRRLTVATVAADLDPLKQDLERVASGDKSDARKVLADLVQARGGLANSFKKALDAMAALKDEGSGIDSPQAMLANWMVPGIKRGQDWLVELTAEDINEEWNRRRQTWQTLLDGGQDADFNRILGDGGEFETFRREYLEPFFEIPGYTPRRKLDGKNLRASAGMASVSGMTMTPVETGPRDASGKWLVDTMDVKLGLGGTLLADSLQIEYTDPSGAMRKSPVFKNFQPPVERLAWTPNVSGHLRFIVDLGGGEMRDSVFVWSGPWAVAQAFADPRCQKRAGNMYVWGHEEPGRGRWEVQLTVTGEMRLVRWYESHGGNPVAASRRFSGKLPTVAVEVVP